MIASEAEGVLPDPEDAVDVLAFVLCPAGVFAPECEASELADLRELLLPIKQAAIDRWQAAARKRRES